MKTSGLSRYALFACFVAITACSQATLPHFQYIPNFSSADQRAKSPLAYHILYSFEGSPDGSGPSGLIDVGGTLYGTTGSGGANCGGGCGTVFSVTIGGKEKVLHSFGKGTDGSYPLSGLIDVSGTLYGTTQNGGAYCPNQRYVRGCGTVFSITPDGKEKVLHSFGKGTDGRDPAAGLIDVGGTLYGTTYEGGDGGCTKYGICGYGTVYSITTGGSEKVLHSFGKGTDGSRPGASLIDVNRTLYGTTFNGGAYGGAYSYGTVFSITTDGQEKVLHSFGKGSDGRYPYAGLLIVNGTLYGTTSQGGVQRGAYTDGTVFSITTRGKEKVLHSFDDKRTDGSYPTAGLIDVSGTLYGTTSAGGAYCHNGSSPGCGTVYSITTGGAEKVLHSFGKGTDGRGPYAVLLDVNGTLYGTTADLNGYNAGTVFSITP